MTHKTDTVFNNKQEYLKNLLIELDDNKQGEYLLIREIWQGKLILWNEILKNNANVHIRGIEKGV